MIEYYYLRGALTALSILAPASDTHASPFFCTSLPVPGRSLFTFAEAFDKSAAGTVSYRSRLDLSGKAYPQVVSQRLLGHRLRCTSSSLFRLQQRDPI